MSRRAVLANDATALRLKDIFVAFTQGSSSDSQPWAEFSNPFRILEMMDAEIQRSLARVDKLHRQAGESPIRKKLRAMGKLP